MVPGSSSEPDSVSRFHDPNSNDWSISVAAILFRPPPHSVGSPLNAARIRSPSGAAPNVMTWHSIARKGRTVGKRLTSSVRHAAAASSSAGPASVTMSSRAWVICSRGTTASICSHTCDRLGGSRSTPSFTACSVTSSLAPVTSMSTLTTAASRVEAFPSFGQVLTFCLFDSRSALASSLLVISTSSRSRASSTARVCRYTTVASSVANRRESECRRSSVALHPVSGQLHQPPRRHHRGVHSAQSQAEDLGRALQRVDHRLSAHSRRRLPERIQPGIPVVLSDFEQTVQ